MEGSAGIFGGATAPFGFCASVFAMVVVDGREPSGRHPALPAASSRYDPYCFVKSGRATVRSRNGSDSSDLDRKERIETFNPRSAE